jgi:endonuclease/exonuclease/phosphatase (EEP) superfamily protein YafD
VGPNRRGASRVLLVVAVLTAAASVLAAMGEHAWWLELFTHFRPQYAVVLLAAGLGLMALGWRVIAVACLVLAGLNAWSLWQYFDRAPPAVGGGTPVRIVLANVWFRSDDYARLVGWVRAEKPDVAVFLEVTPAWEQALAALGPGLPYRAHSGELLIASRRPLVGLRSVPLSNEGAMAMGFTWAEGGRSLTVVGAHANWPLGPRIARARDAELGMLAGLARAVPQPLVVVGDFNVTAFSPAFARLLRQARLTDCAAGRGWHPTWPVFFPPAWLQIDHCLHSGGIEVDAVRTGPFVGSDHYPLVVDLRVLPEGPTGNGVVTVREPGRTGLR